MERDDMEKKIREDEDFIKAPKHQNSLNKYLAKNDDLLHNRAIGKLLLIHEDEVERIYQESIVELRKEMLDGQEDSD